MKITDNTDNITEFRNLEIGDLFRDNDGDISMKIKPLDNGSNALILASTRDVIGLNYELDIHYKATLLNAELIIS